MWNLKTKLFAVLIATTFAPFSSQACQWVITGKYSREIECRSSYANFFKIRGNSESFNKMLSEAVYLALGEAEKATVNNWAIRSVMPINEAQKLGENRIKAEELIIAINQELRKIEAQDGDVETIMPKALLVGLTTPVDINFTALSFIPGWLKALRSQGGSVFAGLMIVPQKVEFVMGQDMVIRAPEKYAEADKDENSDEFLASLGEIVELESEDDLGNRGLWGHWKLRFDTRFVAIPSLDLPLRVKAGEKSKNTDNLFKWTVGFVFGRNINTTHQLLNSGVSVSVPGSMMPAIAKFNDVTKKLFVNRVGEAVYKYVDTIKVGRTLFGAQNAFTSISKKDTVNFHEQTYIWFRLANAQTRRERALLIGKVRKARALNLNVSKETTNEGTINKIKEAASGLVDGQLRVSGFTVAAFDNDNESSNLNNGLSGADFEALSTGLLDSLKTVFSASSLPISDDMTPKEQLVALRKSLEANERAEEKDKLSTEQELAIRRAIEDLEEQLGEEGSKNDKKEKKD